MKSTTHDYLIFSCSGAADVGGITDRAARRLAQDADVSLCCTAAIAAGIPPILERAERATRIVAIDGCDKACARSVLENAGFQGCAHVELGALDMEKNASPESEERIEQVVGCARRALAGS